jgi:hypothetical protein
MKNKHENPNNLDKYDTDVLDIDDVAGTDIKINPDFYVHYALIKAQNCLVKDNVEGGMLQFVMVVEHIIMLCRSANMLPDDYDKILDDYANSVEVQSFKGSDLARQVKLANKKLGLIMGNIFSSRIITDPFKL